MPATTAEPTFSLRGRRVWVAGHRGLVGQALLRRLEREGCELLTVDRAEVDLRRQEPTEAWVAKARPDVIFLAAAKVGGIAANQRSPGDFLYDNLAIQANVFEAARRAGVAKVIALGSSCIYPRLATQPMSEGELLTGPLEPTNQWYAIAKIAGLKLGQAFRKQHGLDIITVLPTNLYGPGDHFDLETSHVVPGMIRKLHEAKQRGDAEVPLWGTGTPRREFLYVDDCADGLVFLAEHYSSGEHINLGVGSDVSIRELAEFVGQAVGYEGRFAFDTSRPDGPPRKLLDIGRLADLGWRPQTELAAGLRDTYQWFVRHAAG
jgi:GDP-L-fucose synthase